MMEMIISIRAIRRYKPSWGCRALLTWFLAQGHVPRSSAILQLLWWSWCILLRCLLWRILVHSMLKALLILALWHRYISLLPLRDLLWQLLLTWWSLRDLMLHLGLHLLLILRILKTLLLKTLTLGLLLKLFILDILRIEALALGLQRISHGSDYPNSKPKMLSFKLSRPSPPSQTSQMTTTNVNNPFHCLRTETCNLLLPAFQQIPIQYTTNSTRHNKIYTTITYIA